MEAPFEISFLQQRLMMKPRVSVVIPAYNSARTIGSTIQSVLNQTFTDLEVVVVEDGSKDNTIEVAERFGERVRCFAQQNRGAAAARNKGLLEARGDYVAFLDSDDLWLPHKLETQLSILEKNSNIDAVQCSVYLVDDHLQVVGTSFCDPSQDSWIDFLLFRNLPGIASTLLVRREKMMALKGFGEDLVILEDWDLACRLARAGTMKSLPECLALYRQHPNNRSRNVDIHVKPGFISLGRLFSDPDLKSDIRENESWIWGRFFAMLAGGYFRNKEWQKGFYWILRALKTSPKVWGYSAGLLIRKLQKLKVSQKKISLSSLFPYAV